MKYKFLLILIFIPNTSLFSQEKFPKIYTPNRTYAGQSIFDIVNIPEKEIDIGLWALIVAKEYDNSVNVEASLNELDEMAKEIKGMLAGRTKDMDIFLATKLFLYEAGKWNNFSPYSYDLDDPLGNVLEHKLLNNYIKSRKGNCVSMPTLFLALMERVDPTIQFVGVKAPFHLFCRLKDRQTKDIWNVETTNGGSPARNQWYIDEMNISETALENRLYLEDLTKKEFIAELVEILVTKERRKENFDKAMEYTNLVLTLSPNAESGLVNKGALFAAIAYKKFQNKQLTDEEDKFYREESEKYIGKAKELGWRPQSKEDRDKYLETIKLEKETRRKNEILN